MIFLGSDVNVNELNCMLNAWDKYYLAMPAIWFNYGAHLTNKDINDSAMIVLLAVAGLCYSNSVVVIVLVRASRHHRNDISAAARQTSWLRSRGVKDMTTNTYAPKSYRWIECTLKWSAIVENRKYINNLVAVQRDVSIDCVKCTLVGSQRLRAQQTSLFLIVFFF